MFFAVVTSILIYLGLSQAIVGVYRPTVPGDTFSIGYLITGNQFNVSLTFDSTIPQNTNENISINLSFNENILAQYSGCLLYTSRCV